MPTVLEGRIRSKVNDGPVTTYRAGESFSELPGDRHGVTKTRRDQPAKLLAMFVVDTDQTELVLPYSKSPIDSRSAAVALGADEACGDAARNRAFGRRLDERIRAAHEDMLAALAAAWRTSSATIAASTRRP